MPPSPEAELAARVGERSVAALGLALAGFVAKDAGLARSDLAALHEGLATFVMRLVFARHAEARGRLPPELVELTKSLRSGAEPNGIRQLTARAERLHRERGGRLFDPRAHAFLAAPLADGCLLEVIDALAPPGDAPDPATVRFAPLPVEHLGSAYEAMMATRVARIDAPSVLLADGLVSLEPLLAASADERVAALTQTTKFGAKRRRAVERAETPAELAAALDAPLLQAGSVTLAPALDRRRAGAHYTPRTLTEPVVDVALAPLFEAGARALDLAVCDPAMGCGAFLLEACRALAERLARERPELPLADARRDVAIACLHGVDKNPMAVELARLSLWLMAGADDDPFTFVDGAIRRGDSLDGAALSFERVVAGRGGFDAFVGNPPWVSYVGRAAQPLDDWTRAHFERNFEAFAGYRNLQGLFVERCAQLLRPGGRLALVIPSSMSELGGYAPTRAAHDRYAVVDETLLDLGTDAFAGVFQPCMALASTRREAPIPAPPTTPWNVARGDLDDASRAILARLAGLAPLPPHLFGERGLQSSGDDVKHFSPARGDAHPVAMRTGSDIQAFRLGPPSIYAETAHFGRRLKTPDDWRRVRVLVRQTARVPTATLSDGEAFRNSLLAGLDDATYTPHFLVAWLNATPVRWLHYMRHRDARQGMPQLKIGHLRATPAPIEPRFIDEIAAIGARLSARNDGIAASEQAELDGVAARALAITDDELARMTAWARALR